MKKLLGLLGSLTLITSASATVIACGGSIESVIKEFDYGALIKQLETDVQKIYEKHLIENVGLKLFGITSTEKNNQFLKRANIDKYKDNPSGIQGNEQTALKNDLEKILDLKSFETSLNNELKKQNKYKIILNDVESLFKSVTFNFETMIIQSNEINDIYLGNVVIDYNIVLQYKGKTDIENFKLKDTLKYTLTDQKLFQEASQRFYQNITKDYFASTDPKHTVHTNLEWNKISKGKKAFEAYGNVEPEIKKYYQDNSKTNSFRTSIINFIQDKYFNILQKFPIDFDGDFIYKGSNFDNNDNSLLATINWYISYNHSNSIKYDYKKEKDKILLETFFRKDPSRAATKNNLNDYYFTGENYKIWQDQFSIRKMNFLKELGMSVAEMDKIKEAEAFKKALSLGYVSIKGLSIKIDGGAYVHQLPDFRIAINYLFSKSGAEDTERRNLSEFSAKTLSAFHETFNVKHDYNKYPEQNTKLDFLMAIKKSTLTEDFNFINFWERQDSREANGNFNLTRDSRYKINLEDYRLEMFRKANLPSNTIYQFAFNHPWHGNDWASHKWAWYLEEDGWMIADPGRPSNGYILNEGILHFNLGYIQFYFDLDKIMKGIKEIEGKKSFIKFV
ncbi:lipoprotein [Spiroplasma cantharicola]|uniref:Lipoprotein n=1 Tax=Spiroplasma cantharicola TaxID=362837 RepID=A0A0M3SJ31_9MOLU|nr:lipoprotein [Spiroplasma cantharicola]ALD66034.1 hypothetical protein SCANT_v1c01240 [Spiroplasma cantharicola]